jgi:hypothetical protein
MMRSRWPEMAERIVRGGGPLLLHLRKQQVAFLFTNPLTG